MLMKNSNNNLWMSPNGHHLDANSSLAATPVSATNQLNEEMRKTANDLLDSMQDSRFSETEVSFEAFIWCFRKLFFNFNCLDFCQN